MPGGRVDWIWLLIGFAIGAFIYPKMHGMLPSIGAKKA